MSNAISPQRVAASLAELWSPRVVAEVDDVYIKVAKVHGSLTWHHHENEDELFLVLKGHLRIEMECQILLIERKSTAHTGDVVTDKTRSLAEQLRPVR